MMMTQKRFPFHRILGPLGLMALLAGCGDPASNDSFIYKMGDRIPVGTLSYNVLEAEWKSDIGSAGIPQTPKHRFLVLKIAITNGGGSQATIPLLTLENLKKESTMEVSEVKELSGWLGLVRLVNPAQTETGVIVFDVPPAAYRLRVTDGKAPGEDQTRLVEIPLSLNEPIRMN